MNKELANLLDLKSAFISYCKTLGCEDNYIKVCSNKFDIIETALNEKTNIENRLDEIFENHNIKSFTELNERLCDYNELKFDDDIKQNNLKAFEIIKKKQVNMYYLLSVDSVEAYNEIVDMKYATYENFYLTQEEFDFLKKALK